MRNFSIAALLFTGLLGYACRGKSDLWVPGLTLPTGSNVIKWDRTDAADAADAARASFELPNQVEKILVVNFDCPDGWESVISKVEDCLLTQGYSNKAAEIASRADGTQAGNHRDLDDSMRSYIKSGSDYEVTILNTRASPHPNPYGSGEFVIIVIEMK